MDMDGEAKEKKKTKIDVQAARIHRGLHQMQHRRDHVHHSGDTPAVGDLRVRWDLPGEQVLDLPHAIRYSKPHPVPTASDGPEVDAQCRLLPLGRGVLVAFAVEGDALTRVRELLEGRVELLDELGELLVLLHQYY